MKDETLALFVCYMKTVLMNARIDFIRKMNTIRRHEVMAGQAYDDEVARLVSDEQLPLEQVISKAFLKRALNSLSAKEAYVLYHVVCLGEPAALSARVLGIAEKSVSRIKQRALLKLKNMLEGEKDNVWV